MSGNDITISLKPRARLSQVDLRKENLTDVDLTAAKLDRANLAGMELSGTILNKADLRQAEINNATLNKVKAIQAQVKGTWENVRCEHVDFTKLIARKWECKNCSFIGVNFSRANLRRAVFNNCTFNDCNFTEANAPDIVLNDTAIENSRFPHSDLSCPTIKNSSFTACVFNQTDLSGAAITQVVFKQCDLQKADLIAGEFSDLVLTDNTLTKANFRYARGLSEEMIETIRAGGGKASKGLFRKIGKMLFGSWPGRIIAIALLLFVLLGITHYRNNPANWSFERLMHEADLNNIQGNQAKALKLYHVLADNYCNDEMRCANIKIGMIQTYQAMKKYDEALALIDQVLGFEYIDPMQQIDLHMHKVQVLIDTKQNQAAVNEIETLLVNPGISQHTESILGQLMMLTNDDSWFDIILTLLDKHKAVFIQPGEVAQVELLKAIIYEKKEHFTQAEELYLSIEAIDNAPDLTIRRAMMSLAEMYMQQNKPQQAQQTYQRLRQRFPDDVNDVLMARLHEAQIALGNGERDKAERMLREVIAEADFGIVYRTAQLSLASLLIDRRVFDEADRLLDDVLNNTEAMEQAYADATILQANSLSRRDRHDDAIELLQPLLDQSYNINTKNFIRRALVDAYRIKGRHEEALELIRLTIENSQSEMEKATDLVTYSELLRLTGNLDEALESLEQALTFQNEANNKMLLEQRICELLQQTDRQEQALKRLQRMSTQDDLEKQQRLWALIEIMNIQRNQGNHQKVNEILNELLEMPFEQGDVPYNLLNITYSDDEEGKRLIRAILQKVIKIEAPAEFVGATSRLTFVNQFYLQSNFGNLPEDEAKKIAVDGEAMLREVIEQNTDFNLIFQGYELLSQIKLQMNDPQGALAVFDEMEKVQTHERTRSLALLGRAIVAVRTDNTDEGLKLYAEAAELCQNDMDCCRIKSEYAQHLIFADRKDDAKKIYQNILETLDDCWGREEAKRFLGED